MSANNQSARPPEVLAASANAVLDCTVGVIGVTPGGAESTVQVTLSDAAIEASDLTLVRGDLRAIPDVIALSRRDLATIKGNLFWAFDRQVTHPPLQSSRSVPGSHAARGGSGCRQTGEPVRVTPRDVAGGQALTRPDW